MKSLLVSILFTFTFLEVAQASVPTQLADADGEHSPLLQRRRMSIPPVADMSDVLKELADHLMANDPNLTREDARRKAKLRYPFLEYCTRIDENKHLILTRSASTPNSLNTFESSGESQSSVSSPSSSALGSPCGTGSEDDE